MVERIHRVLEDLDDLIFDDTDGGPNESPAYAREIYRGTDCGTCGWGLCEQSQQGGEDDDFGDVPFPLGQ